MKALTHILRRFTRSERGTALVELGMIIPLFLLLIFAILEYGRLYWNITTAQKAMHIASRMATVGPPLCGALPDSHTLAGGAPTTTKYGTLCRGNNVCATPTLPAPCSLDTSTPYGSRIWSKISPLLPPNTSVNNVQFTYSHDSQLGFLGGPYTPVVTAEIVNLEFDFVIPIGPLAALAVGDPTITSTKSTSITIPSMSTSVPGEDLAAGAAE